MTKEEATFRLFQLNKTFRDLSILVYDEHDKLRGQIPRKKPPDKL
jgi:hypothetical protein